MDYPSGWLLRMKQYPRRTYEQFDAFEREFAHMGEGITHYTAFGNFDRVEFVPIYRFGDYQDKITSDSSWFGKQQPILLYTLKECGQKSVFQMVKMNDRERLGANQGPLECRFFVHTMVYVSGTAKMKFADYRDFLKLIVKKIHDIVDCYREAKVEKEECLEYEVFGTFNSAEISIVWAVDQYIDVLYLVDRLRYLRFAYQDGREQKICVSTYTVISANKEHWSKAGAKGTAMVQLECSTEYDRSRPDEFGLDSTMTFIKNVFKNAGAHFEEQPDRIGNNTLLSCAGEYDFIVNVPFSVLTSIFNNEAENTDGLNFSAHNKKFARHIRQTTTRLGYQEDDIDEACRNIEWDKILTFTLEKSSLEELFDDNDLDVINQIAAQSDKSGEVYSLYKRLYTQMEKLVPYSGLHKTLELLYRDYVEIQCTAIDHLWVKDYHEQFVVVLKIIESYLKSLKEAVEHGFPETGPARYLQDFKELFGILQQQVNHISESSKLFFEAPNSKMGYTAQFDLIMHAYYGIVKELIQRAYSTPKTSWQHLLVPVINFANTNIIESAMQRTLEGDSINSRLISIQVPYGSWSNPLYYTPFIFHEVYHYIAPADRKVRNTSFLVIILHKICMEWLIKALDLFFSDKLHESISEPLSSMVTFTVKLNLSDGEVQKITAKSTSQSEKQNIPEGIAWNISKEFAQPLYRAISEDRENLHTLISCNADCTAFELRDALNAWFTVTENSDNIIKWIQEKVRSAARLMLQTREPLHGERSNNQDDLQKQKLNAFCQDFIDRGLALDWAKVEDLKDAGIDQDQSLSMLCWLREIYPDIAMIKGTSMGLCEYLLQFAMLQNNLLNTPSAVSEWDLPLRLGPIIEHLLEPGKTLSSKREAFEKLFTAYLALSSGKSPHHDVDIGDKHLAKQWFDFFINIYKQYKEEYAVYGQELSTQIENQYIFDESFASLTKGLYAEYWKLLGSYWEDNTVPERLFDLAIRLIQLHQGQNSLIQLRKVWEKQRGGAMPVENPSTPTTAMPAVSKIIPSAGENSAYVAYYLNGCDALFEKIRKMIRQLDNNHEHIFGEPCGASGIWYRGISNSDYHILPSMFVHYSKGSEWDEKKPLKTPAEILEHRFQQFKFRSDGAPELTDQPSYQSSDYLALMQHYQVRTNMLDWSEDIFGALYFALEDYFKQAPTKMTEDAVNAAVYLFDPAAYNKARADILKELIPENNGKQCNRAICSMKGDWECYMSQCRKHREGYARRTAFEARGDVPNVSVDLNQDIYAPLFCSQKREYADGRTHYTVSQMTKFAPVDNAPMCFDLPVAVYTSRLNPRIRAQSGQFVVYDPYTPPVFPDSGAIEPKNLEGCYDYIALDNIQKKWLAADTGRRPFLLKLEISSHVKYSLAQQLRHMGINPVKYYPELGNAHFSFD